MTFEKFRIRCAKILPAVYDDSLSYYETLCKMRELVNTLIDYINQFDYDEIQRQLNAFREYIDTEIAKEDAKITALYKSFDEYKIAVDLQIAQQNSEIAGIRNSLASITQALTARIDQRIAENNEYIFAQIDQGLIDIKVINYFTGEIVSIQEMFDYLASLHLQDAIDYDGLAAKSIDYDSLAALSITYTQLAMNGNSLIP